ncbi:MAG: ATP-binding protein [Hyphomonadaceae bacterium]|nr:ATP-binding protein [Hyphomonadaceae bacterium]
MAAFELFPKDKVVGIFRGFQQGGLEFHADLVMPYRNDFQNIPMHGQFVLVQLETPDEAVMGRIASFSSEGKLSFGSGEEFNIRAVREERPIPEDLREQYLKYRINIRVLGVIRRNGNGLTFVPSHRRLPHVGSKVAFPSNEVLREIAGHNIDGAAIGHLAFGEYIYYGGTDGRDAADWMQIVAPEVQVRFPVQSLVSRRSFIFARAGFGKSNLNKLLFAELYRETPTVPKRNGRNAPVGTVVFDPDGEYFWPDDKGRPGLCDVPSLEDKLVVFTERRHSSAFYQSFVAGGIKLDIRRLRPSDVIAIALSPERQEQQNVRKLRGLPQPRWEQLVNLIDEHGNTASMDELCQILDLDRDRQEAEALAARSNMTTIVRMLHDKSSQLMDMHDSCAFSGKTVCDRCLADARWPIAHLVWADPAAHL